ncbi:MAG TPA: TatD family hydrolase [Mycobacteriales bacterium]|nr:TatD family hydrolase [Mycobacteriales bacterium]
MDGDPLPVDVVDSHCHLDLMKVPVADTLAAARAVGVRRVVTVGYDVDSSRWCARTAAEHDALSAAVAVHPNGAHLADEAAYDEIARLAALPQVRAVGETGLDHYRSGAERWPRQEESFRRHIALAKQAGKALVVHDRDAHADVLRVLAAEGAPDPTVFHCFSGDAALAATCVDRGYVLSFAGNVTFKNAQNLRSAAAVVPLDLLLVETDAPFLTPVPYRGRPNAPALVALTVRAVAAAQHRDVAEVAAAVASTADRVFGPSPSGPSSTLGPPDGSKRE